MERRRFNRSEKNALYTASGGVCANCGVPLDVGWHGDHVQPYSKGGETSIVNGQALCPKCNRQKGAKDLSNTISFRPFQARFIDTAIRKMKDRTDTSKPAILVADVHPGSGKTISALCAADLLIKEGYIDQVAVFVPRLNLAAQFEQDWFDIHKRLPWTSTMRMLVHRPNELPLVINGADGWISTYGSLVSNPQIHLAQIASKRTLLIFDEAQQLGVDYDGSTQSAKWAEEAGNEASMVVVMSGTPVRADGSRLLFATYADKPNEHGVYLLQSDVSSTYRDGVRDGYLRRFEAILHDGGIKWRDLIEGDRDLTLSEMAGSIRPAIQHEGFWKPMVDRFIEKLVEVKKIDSHLCGMIAADDQTHARKIMEYIRKQYPAMKALIAVSDDGDAAHKSLSDFRVGKHDILVTVQMAYVGYDHKPITVMLVLTSFRTEAYLRQLLARGLRVYAKVEPKHQTLYAFVPDDPKMREFVEKLREESQWGYDERRQMERQETEISDQPRAQQTLGYILDAWITQARAMGIDPTGDLSPEDYERVEQLRVRMGLPYPATDLIAFHRALMGSKPEDHQENRRYITHQEQITLAKSELRKLCGRCDKALQGWKGETYDRLKWRFNGGTDTIQSVEEAEQRMKVVNRWIAQGRYD